MGTCGFHMLPASHSGTVLYNACFAFHLLLTLDLKKKKQPKKTFLFPKHRASIQMNFMDTFLMFFPLVTYRNKRKNADTCWSY